MLQRFAAAENDANAAVECCFGFAGDEVVGFLDDGSSLAVSEDRPRDAGVFELADADLTRESTIRPVEDVLSGDFDSFTEMFASQEQVYGGR